MSQATRTAVLYAATAGLALGVIRAALFAFRGGGAIGGGAPVPAAFVFRIGLMATVVGGALWWLFVARREPSQTSVTRGVIVGATSVVVSAAIFPLTQLVNLIVSGLRTEGVGPVAEAAGEGALLGVAGVLIALLSGWMDVLAAMAVGGMLVYWHRRRSAPAPRPAVGA